MILDGLEMLNKVPSIPSIIIAFFLGHFSGLISIDEILMVRSGKQSFFCFTDIYFQSLFLSKRRFVSITMDATIDHVLVLDHC